jgi:hypothetical protein
MLSAIAFYLCCHVHWFSLSGFSYYHDYLPNFGALLHVTRKDDD